MARLRESVQQTRFFDDLVLALKGDSHRARDLQSTLWAGVIDWGQTPTEDDSAQIASQAIQRSEQARAVSKMARELAERLEALDPHVPDALFRLFLPPVSVGALLIAETGSNWQARDAVRIPLADLARDAERWADKEKARSKKRSGMRPDLTRLELSEWVAWQLHRHGVRLTISKEGVFQRVLAAVQNAAGFQDRTAANVERDAKHALKVLQDADAFATQSAVEKLSYT